MRPFKGLNPAVANGIIYIGSYDHNLYALNATNGTMLWGYRIGNPSSPAIANGIAYVENGSSNVYALNAATGTKIS